MHRLRFPFCRFFYGVGLLVILSSVVWAGWMKGGVPICTAPGNQGHPTMASDGAGGVIITWHDDRIGDSDIYAQRLDAYGETLWSDQGVAMCTATGEQLGPSIVSDAAGGAIIEWLDYRSGNHVIYAQRVDGDGNKLWQEDGVVLCDGTWSYNHQSITSDGAGGAVVAWEDGRPDSTGVYAQRVSADGDMLWGTCGATVCTGIAPGAPSVISDGAGGAIIVWSDPRNGAFDLYAQRLDASGNRLWGSCGVAVCINGRDKKYPAIASDAAGGVFVAWCDPARAYGIYIQHLDAGGNELWESCGLAACPSNGAWLVSDSIVEDGAGGAVVTWYDPLSDYDIYAQRVSLDGDVAWPPSGIPICTAPGIQQHPRVASGGICNRGFIVWEDDRNGNMDVYAMAACPLWQVRPDGFGDAPTIQAGVDSAADLDIVSLAPGTFTGVGNRNVDLLYKNLMIVSEAGCGSTIIDCEGDPANTQRGFYFHGGQDSCCVLYGVTIKNCFASADSAPPLSQGGGILCDGASPTFSNILITGCSAAWGGGISCWSSSLKVESATISSNVAAGDPQSSGGALACFDNSEVTAVNCILWGDTAATAETEVYVDATSKMIFECCDVDFPGVGGPGDVIWRGGGNIFTNPLFCGIVYCDTSAWDPDTCSCNPDAGQFDLHADSPCAAENNPVCGQIGARPVNCYPTTGLPKGPSGLSARSLLWNSPNPFTRSTRITYVVPNDASGAQVLLRIYDPLGRLVRRLVDSHKPSGMYRAVWDGRNGAGRLAPGGVYFYQLQAGDLAETRRMVLVR